MPRDQDRSRLRGQIYSHLARDGEGPHPERDRHHEPPAPLQTHQPPRCIRG